MTRKRQRLLLVIAGLGLLGVATGLVLFALRDSIVFFYSPTQVVEQQVPVIDRDFRIGGLVQDLQRLDANTVTFGVTDLKHTVPVSYTGVLPSLFKEGQGVVAEGRLGSDGRFLARQVLAKHDETYMPAEVVNALKAAGEWKGN